MRRLRAGMLVLLAAAVLTGAAGYPVYVRPQVDDLRPADAILVVGGDAPQGRYRHGLELARQGWAPLLVLSNPGGQMDRHCAGSEPGVRIECFEPQPRTTRGEARALRRMANERGWRTVIVVTYPPHVSRARYIMGRCFDGELVMTAAPTRLSPAGWAWMYLYQSAGFAKAFAERGC